MNTIHKIKSPASPKGFRFESLDRKAAERRLAEVRKRDPQAKIVSVPVAGR